MFAAFLFFIFVGPVIEWVIALIVASYIGLLNTLMLVVLTSIIGLVLLKVEGLAAIREVRRDLSRGTPPARGLVDGVLRVSGAMLLALPGLVTAVIGILLLLRPIRRLIAPLLLASLAKRAKDTVARVRIGQVLIGPDGRPRSSSWDSAGPGEPGRFIDAEGWEIEERLELPGAGDVHDG